MLDQICKLCFDTDPDWPFKISNQSVVGPEINRHSRGGLGLVLFAQLAASLTI